MWGHEGAVLENGKRELPMGAEKSRLVDSGTHRGVEVPDPT